MMASSTAIGQDETDDAKYLSWKLWTESDMTMIVLLGSKSRTRLLMSQYRRTMIHSDSR